MASIRERTVGGKPRYDVSYREPDCCQSAPDVPPEVRGRDVRGRRGDRQARAAATSTRTPAGSPSGSTRRSGWRTRPPSRPRGSGSSCGCGCTPTGPRVEAPAQMKPRPSSRGSWASLGSASTRRVVFGTSRRSCRPRSRRADQEEPGQGWSVSPRREPGAVSWTGERVAAVREALADRYRVARISAPGSACGKARSSGSHPTTSTCCAAPSKYGDR